MSRSYPIWIDTYNNAYSNNGAKSQGVRDYAKSEMYIGTSAANSTDLALIVSAIQTTAKKNI